MRSREDAIRTILRSEPLLAIAARATQGAAMAAGAIVILFTTSLALQGFYFTFIGFGILLQLCDFGLSYASLQAATRLKATDREAAIVPLARRALAINAGVTFVAWLVVAALGWIVFDRAEGHDDIAWRTPWACFVALVAINQLSGPYLFLVEGGVSVRRAWRFRLIQECGSGAVLLAVLVLHGELWGLVGYYAARSALAGWWVVRAPLRLERARAVVADVARWRDDLWPFQWRVGIGAISGYLVFQAFGPMLFTLQGAEGAGRFSMSLSIMNAIVMVTTAWPVSQAAHFGALVSRGERDELMRRWSRVLVRSTALAALIGIALAGGLALLDGQAPAIAARFAAWPATVALIATAVLHHAIACLSVVLRAQGRDPLLLFNVGGGVLVLVAMTVAAAHGTLTLVASVYFACMLAMTVVAAGYGRAFAARVHGLGR